MPEILRNGTLRKDSRDYRREYLLSRENPNKLQQRKEYMRLYMREYRKKHPGRRSKVVPKGLEGFAKVVRKAEKLAKELNHDSR